LTFSSRGIRHNSINRGGSCLQGLLGDSYDSRSHQTQVQDMSGIIGYGSSSFGMWKNVNRDDERYWYILDINLNSKLKSHNCQLSNIILICNI